jgi:hypothetical protein
MPPVETVQFQISPEFRQELETAAANLHLSVGAYVFYLHMRLARTCDADRLDRHVREVFAKHGELMQRLAK